MKYILKSDEIVLENEIFSGYIFIEDGIIKKITKSKEGFDGQLIDLSPYKILPGLIDIHVHGGNGEDTMNGTFEAINSVSKFKISEGVTSFCPTTVTAPDKKTRAAIINVKEAIKKGVDGANIIGTFLEGPFINPEYKGAHPEEYILDIDMDLIDEYLKIGEGTISSIAIAPEKKGGFEAIEELSKRGINIRIGHSAATDTETFEAIDKGAEIAIHTYNAMTPLNHRRAGMVGAILSDDRIYNELIADLVHVDKTAIHVLVKCKKDKIILVTDCMEAGGLQDGDYKLGELDVVVKDSIARTKHDGAIAGSTLNLMTALKNMNKEIGVDLTDAVKMASLYPAEALKIDSLTGSIKEGKKADLVCIDNDFKLKLVLVNGEIKLKNQE